MKVNWANTMKKKNKEKKGFYSALMIHSLHDKKELCANEHDMKKENVNENALN